jgi:hypothetical protein
MLKILILIIVIHLLIVKLINLILLDLIAGYRKLKWKEFLGWQ